MKNKNDSTKLEIKSVPSLSGAPNATGQTGKKKKKEKTTQMNTTILTRVINHIYQRKIDLLVHREL